MSDTGNDVFSGTVFYSTSSQCGPLSMVQILSKMFSSCSVSTSLSVFLPSDAVVIPTTVAPVQQAVNGGKESSGTKSLHQTVQVLPVEIILVQVQAWMYSLTGMVDLASIAVFPLVVVDCQVQQM